MRTQNVLFRSLSLMILLVSLGACESVSSFFDTEEPRLEGDRIPVLSSPASISGSVGAGDSDDPATEDVSAKIILPPTDITINCPNAVSCQASGNAGHTAWDVQQKWIEAGSAKANLELAEELAVTPTVGRSFVIAFDRLYLVTATGDIVVRMAPYNEKDAPVWRLREALTSWQEKAQSEALYQQMVPWWQSYLQSAQTDDLTPTELPRMAVTASGVWVIALPAGRVIGLDAHDFTVKWVRDDLAPMWGAWLVTSSSTAPKGQLGVAIHTGIDGVMRAIDTETGRDIWTQTTDAQPVLPQRLTSGIIFDEAAYMPAQNGDVLSLRHQRGGVLWADSVARSRSQPWLDEQTRVMAPLVGDAATILAINQEGDIIAYDRLRGVRQWTRALRSAFVSPRLAGPLALVISRDGILYGLLSRSGAERFQFDIAGALGLDTDEVDDRRDLVWGAPFLGDRTVYLVEQSQGILIRLPLKPMLDGQPIVQKIALSDDALGGVVWQGRTLWVLSGNGALRGYHGRVSGLAKMPKS